MTNLDKREAILQTALELFAERGFHNTPMSLLAKQSGASAGTIYHHFTDKDDLIHELYHYVKTKFYRAMIVGYDTELAREEAFRQMWINAYRFYSSHRVEVQFLDHYENSPYYHPEIPTGEAIENEENLPVLFRLIVDANGKSLAKDLPIDALYELTIGVAARVAKHHNAGLPALGEAALVSIADACYQAIML